jgi:hypothetical protein
MRRAYVNILLLQGCISGGMPILKKGKIKETQALYLIL